MFDFKIILKNVFFKSIASRYGTSVCLMQKCKINDIKKLPNYSNGWKGSLRSQNENCPARYVLTPGLTFKKITIFPSVPPGRSQSQTHPEHTVRTRLISPSLNVWKNISKINTRTFSGSFIIPCCNITGIAFYDSYLAPTHKHGTKPDPRRALLARTWVCLFRQWPIRKRTRWCPPQMQGSATEYRDQARQSRDLSSPQSTSWGQK